jgi:hypothetical protein
MTDLRYIQDLVAILKTHQVSHIKMQGLELTFHVEHTTNVVSTGLPYTTNVVTDDSTQIIADALKKQEESMPPDLRADALMDQEKILNWSSPDQKSFDQEPELPLTGEQPL